MLRERWSSLHRALQECISGLLKIDISERHREGIQTQTQVLVRVACNSRLSARNTPSPHRTQKKNPNSGEAQRTVRARAPRGPWVGQERRGPGPPVSGSRGGGGVGGRLEVVQVSEVTDSRRSDSTCTSAPRDGLEDKEGERETPWVPARPPGHTASPGGARPGWHGGGTDSRHCSCVCPRRLPATAPRAPGQAATSCPRSTLFCCSQTPRVGSPASGTPQSFSPPGLCQPLGADCVIVRWAVCGAGTGGQEIRRLGPPLACPLLSGATG